jgi:hypothetical protein
MIRSISFVGALLCALVLASGATAGNLSLSLNLEFNTLGDQNSGGTWTVVAKAEERGIAAVVMRFLDSSLNFDPNTGFFLSDVFEIQVSGLFGLQLEIVEGEDPFFGATLDVGVIGGTFPSAYVDDPDLVLFGVNPDLGSFTGGVELVTGSFDPGDIPEWISGSGAANLYVDPGAVITAAENVFLTVRHIVPEPATFALLGLGLAGAMFLGRRK